MGNNNCGSGSGAGDGRPGAVNARNGNIPTGGDDDPYRDIGLAQVGGLERQKEALRQSILNHFKDGSKHAEWGLEPPKGVLFHGPPGTGKTLLARAFGNSLSAEIGRPVTFYHRKGGDLLSKWVGESGRMIKELFREAKRNKPAVIFLDELDGICPTRDDARGGQGSTSVVTTILSEMDDLKAGEVFVFGATNRLNAVDPAVLRPGRMELHLEFLPPNLEDRKAIIRICTGKWKRSHLDEAGLEEIGRTTSGFTGADLDKLCREAFFAAFARHVPEANLDIGIEDLEVTRDDWITGLAKTRASNSNSFGSTIYTPQQVPALYLPLIQAPHEQIRQRLAPLMQFPSIENYHVETFFVFQKKRDYDDSLENVVLASVLGDDSFKEIPIFRLSKLDIMKSRHPSALVDDTINQAVTSVRPCILFIPRIDVIEANCGQGIVSQISQSLTTLRGKPVLILATGELPPTRLRSLQLRQFFEDPRRTYSVQKPTEQERKNFLHHVFYDIALRNRNGVIPQNIPADLMNDVAKLHEDAVFLTQGGTITGIVKLRNQMLRTCGKCMAAEDPMKTLAELQEDVGNFRVPVAPDNQDDEEEEDDGDDL